LLVSRASKFLEKIKGQRGTFHGSGRKTHISYYAHRFAINSTTHKASFVAYNLNTENFRIAMTQTVLVTGASGFVAGHVLNEFLNAGYNVRAAVRSEATADKVRKTHSKHPEALSFVIVPDISVPGAFNEAVKGVDGVS
jgi:L-serine deaminase